MIIIISILLILLIAYFIFRKKGIEEVTHHQITKDNFVSLLDTHIDFYHNLDTKDKTQFEGMVKDFLSEIKIEGIGTEVSDLDRVMIASAAVIPIFGFPEWRYKNLTNVILYPNTFDKEFQFEGENRNILGMVGSGYMNGQMLLSRLALTKGFSSSHGKENTAIHEFVHLLDKSDGATDGIPENLMKNANSIPWLHMMHEEMHRIQSGRSDIDVYALTNEAEFLAVVSEYFFEKPGEFKGKHAELYEQLSQIFNQHPVTD